MKEDTNLIKKVQAKSTGANIHWVNNAIGRYRQWVSLFNMKNFINEEDKQNNLYHISESANTLRLFLEGNPKCGCPSLQTHKLP